MRATKLGLGVQKIVINTPVHWCVLYRKEVELIVGGWSGFLLQYGFVTPTKIGIVQSENLPAEIAAERVVGWLGGQVLATEAERSPFHDTSS